MTQRTHAQKVYGQYLTPHYVADLMASFFDDLPAAVRLIDPGAGEGALTEAVVRRACKPESGVRSIDVTTYELDQVVLPELRRTLQKCEVLCRTEGVAFRSTIQNADFVAEATEDLTRNLLDCRQSPFNIAIVNPPYKKISANSRERLALRRIGLETSNLYAGFVGVLARLIENGGQLVAITPRSFCNGPYFLPFRKDLLRMMRLRKLHVFESRSAAFRGDEVLQENIILHATKGGPQSSTVIMSSSSGEKTGNLTARPLPLTDIVEPHDDDRFIHIPVVADHIQAKARIATLSETLDSLGVAVSTGPVVDFRLKDALRSVPTNETVPLVYPSHFACGKVKWPLLEGKKPNAIMLNETTRPWLIPAGLYVLTKRFTSKEERRRVVACLLDPADIQSEWLGLENHLNFIHAHGKGLERNLAHGLFAFLNSTLVDHYFRCFSGHTQVNATDLRKLPFPNIQTLRAIGEDLRHFHVGQEHIDYLLDRHLNGI